ISANSVWTTSLSRMTVITWRRACRSPRLAKVTSFSAYGRSRFALAAVVVIRPCSNSDVARLASISRSCAGDPPRRGPLVGVGMSVLPQAAGPRCRLRSMVVLTSRALRAGWCLRASVAGAAAVPDGGSPRRPAGPAACPRRERASGGGSGVLLELLGLLVGAVVVLRLVVAGGEVA